MKKIITIDLGGTSSKLGIISEDGQTLSTWTLPTDISESGTKILPNLIQSIKSKIKEENISYSSLKGIGMGSPGAIDYTDYSVSGAFNLNWGSKTPIGQVFQEAFDLPFVLDNDANLAALGEQWQGAGKGLSDVVMMTLGTGVGGGVIINGQLIHGAGAAGELGHMPVDFKHRIRCTCGNVGCLETVGSASGVVNLYNYYQAHEEEFSQLIEEVKSGGKLSSSLVFDHAKRGDQFGLKIVDLVAFYLAVACANIASVVNPQSIILGGGLSQAGEFLLERIVDYFVTFVHPAVAKSTSITLAKLSNDAGILGAGQLVNLRVE